MTADEWDACDDPTAMLAAVRLGDRRLRLFAAACCRRIWPLLAEDASRRAVEVAERFADGAATARELRAALVAAARATDLHDPMSGLAGYRAESAATAAVNAAGPRAALRSACENAADAVTDRAAERAAQAALLRCVFGNPLRPITFPASWRTFAAVGIAEGIYADRAWDRLPILADALEDAGCTDPDVLAHCRGDGPHVRGCWVVDNILGRS
jgi:hypothetical protein